MMLKSISKICGVMSVFGLLVACLFGSIDYQAFNKKYYEKKYTELDTAQSIGMSDEALFDATFTLLDYLKDKRDDIVCVQNVKGQEREVFDERETAHMIDVKDLYLNTRMICLMIAGIGLFSFVAMLYLVKYKEYPLSMMFSDLKDGLRQVVWAFVIVISGLLFYALVDFNRFWTVFHQIFFTNDLWLLDPRVSIMINMFPEEFFFGMVMRIAITFIVSFIGLTAFVYWYTKKIIHAIENESK